MDRIIFFDIDKTLFDRENYLGNFFKILDSEFKLTESEVDEVGNYYQEIKNEYGFFSSEAFLARIYITFPILKNKLNYYFLPENNDKYLFKDSEVLFEIRNSRIGIFSKGDTKLQKAKIVKFESVIEEDLVFIYHNKIDNLPQILKKHKDSEIIIVDDNVAVLICAKDLNKNVITVLIDRQNNYDTLNNVDFRISSLFDIMPILK